MRSPTYYYMEKMDEIWSSSPWVIASLSAVLALLLLRWMKPGGSAKCLPPGPPKWPVLGNMLDLGTIPHQSLYKLRFDYGPVLWLKLGLVNTMVVQSAEAAAQLFKHHDHIFCDRKVPHSLTAWDYDEGSVAIGRYGKKWQLLRRLCSTELRRVNETIHIRRKCVDNMIRWIEQDSSQSRAQGGSGAVEISRFVFLMSFNLVGNIVVSRDILEPESGEGREFFDAMNGFVECAGKPNVADFFPFLKPFDPFRIKRSMVRAMGQAIKIVSKFVKERMEQKQMETKEKHEDLLDVMLETVGDGKEESDKISDRIVTIIIMEMFFAGTDTTSSTLEWAIAELLRSPPTMRKIKEELDRVIGTKQKVGEDDMDNLPYLQAVVKETLRLHPPVPLLLPRNAMQDSNYMGYSIPKNTQVYVNVWAIGRDPESWDDPLSFKPERFLGKNIDYKGQHFELLPFGSGRRICVGLSLAHRILHLALATMLQTFDWKLEESVVPEAIDMNERMGIALRKLVPLKAIPERRTA